MVEPRPGDEAVEAVARWLWDYDTSGNDGEFADGQEDEYRDSARDLLASLRGPVEAERPGLTAQDREAIETLMTEVRKQWGGNLIGPSSVAVAYRQLCRSGGPLASLPVGEDTE
jgi:hypothetical protein